MSNSTMDGMQYFISLLFIAVLTVMKNSFLVMESSLLFFYKFTLSAIEMF